MACLLQALGCLDGQRKKCNYNDLKRIFPKLTDCDIYLNRIVRVNNFEPGEISHKIRTIESLEKKNLNLYLNYDIRYMKI